MNRRALITTGAVAAAAPFLLAKRAAATTPTQIDALRRVMHPGAYQLLLNTVSSAPGFLAPVALSTVLRMVNDHSSALDLDAVMRGPVDQIAHAGRTYVVQARTRKYAARWTLNGPESSAEESDVYDALAQELADEMRRERRYLIPGSRFCVLAPVIPAIVVDPNTFEPVTMFSLRYGIIAPDSTPIA